MSQVMILPNLRKGLSNEIDASIRSKDGLRAGFNVQVKLSGHRTGSKDSGLTDLAGDGDLVRPFYLAGPVDVQRIAPEAVCQAVPADKSVGYSSGYMPFLEFFEEDLPWRYTPLPSSDKLPPWILLLACAEGEYTLKWDEHGNKRVEIHLEDLSYDERMAFYPDKDRFHRLAHVQVTTPGNENPVNHVKDYPDDGISRLFCSRPLRKWTKYTVFLVPAFELGRLAGLGMDFSSGVGLDKYSWEGNPVSTVFPVYYQWSFTTGADTFLSYAKKQSFISRTDFNALSPGLQADISDTGLKRYRLLNPLVNDYEPIDVPVALVKKGFSEKDLSAEDPRMDDELRDDLLVKSPVFSDDDDVEHPVYEDPWVVPPVYGARHILARPQDLKNDNLFLKDLNLKFRNRVAAGLGSRVVKENQEMFMNRAWGMVEEVNDLNQRVREFYQVLKTNDAAEAKNSPLRFYKFKAHVSGLQADAAIRVANAQSAAKINQLDLSTDVAGGSLHVMTTSMGDYTRTAGISLDELETLSQTGSWDMEEVIKKTELYKRLTGLIDFFEKADPKYRFLSEILVPKYPDVLVRVVNDPFANMPGPSSNSIWFSIISGEDEVFRLGIKRTAATATDNQLGIKDSEQVIHWLDDTDKFYYYSSPAKKRSIQDLIGLLKGAKKEYSGRWGGNSTKVDGSFGDLFLPINSELKRNENGTTFTDYLFFMRLAAYEHRFKDAPNGIVIYLLDGSRVYIVPESKITENGGNFNYSMYAEYASGAQIGSIQLRYTPENNRSRLFLSSGYYTPEKEIGLVPAWDLETVGIRKSAKSLYAGDRGLFLHQLASYFRITGTVKIERSKSYRATVKLEYVGNITLEFDDYGQTLKVSGSAKGCKDTSIFFDTDYGLFRRQDNGDILVYGDKFRDYLLEARSLLQWWSLVAWTPNKVKLSHHFSISMGPNVAPSMSSYPTVLLNCKKVTADEMSGMDFDAVPGSILNTARDVSQQIQTLASNPKLREILAKKTAAKQSSDKMMAAKEAEDKRKEGIPVIDADEVNRERLIERAKAFAERGMTLDLLESNFDGKYPVMAAPMFPDPTSFYLRELSDRFLLPSVDELKMNSISCFQTNPVFEEAFLAGMNTEMGRELLWREYPTDERGSYFRKFWDQDDLPNDFANRYFDVKFLHNWKKRLGQNHEDGKEPMVVFVIKSELLCNYPQTRICLARWVKDKDGDMYLDPILSPAMTGWLSNDTFMAGFRPGKLSSAQGVHLAFLETDKSQRFLNKGDVQGSSSDELGSDFAVNRVDTGSAWGIELQPDTLKS